jgi:hypothetical protein
MRVGCADLWPGVIAASSIQDESHPEPNAERERSVSAMAALA